MLMAYTKFFVKLKMLIDAARVYLLLLHSSSFRETSTQICSNKCGWYYFRWLTVVAGGTRVSSAFTGTFKCVSSLRALASVFTVVWHTPRKRERLKTLEMTRSWKDFFTDVLHLKRKLGLGDKQKIIYKSWQENV